MLEKRFRLFLRAFRMTWVRNIYHWDDRISYSEHGTLPFKEDQKRGDPAQWDKPVWTERVLLGIQMAWELSTGAFKEVVLQSLVEVKITKC